VLQHFVDKGLRNFSFVDEMIAPGQFVRLAEAIKNSGMDITLLCVFKAQQDLYSGCTEVDCRIRLQVSTVGIREWQSTHS